LTRTDRESENPAVALREEAPQDKLRTVDGRTRSMAEASCPRHLRLSKSKIMAFEHCPRRLWLQVHRRELARIDPATRALFSAGHLVGVLAQQATRDGVLVLAQPDADAARERTASLLRDGWNRPIFEATFQHRDVLIRADILEPDGRGGWSMVEVKNSTSVRPYHLRDLATQAWVARGSGIRISSFILRGVNRRVRDATDLPHCRFVDVDVTWRILGVVPGRWPVIAAAADCIRGPEPKVLPGRHCTRPFVCEFRAHCADECLHSD